MSLAKAVISGTVESDPEKRFTSNNTAVTNFTLAVQPTGFGNANRDQGPFYVKVACWRGMADAAVEQIKKGDQVLVDGKLSINTYQTPEGVQKKNYEIEAQTLNKLPGMPQAILPAFNEDSAGSRGSAANRSSQQSATGVAATAGMSPPGTNLSNPTQSGQGFMTDDLLTEDDIPF